jgi:hypothetical protein
LDRKGGGLSTKRVHTSVQIAAPKLREADVQLAAVCRHTSHELADELAEKEVRKRLVADSLPTKGLEQRSIKERSLGERFGLDF